MLNGFATIRALMIKRAQGLMISVMLRVDVDRPSIGRQCLIELVIVLMHHAQTSVRGPVARVQFNRSPIFRSSLFVPARIGEQQSGDSVDLSNIGISSLRVAL